jgi:hypothetical protein
MGERLLSDGQVGYYWYPHRRTVAGFTILCERGE